ncbi:MAG: YdcF family protein [Syntrophaceae bacterium]|nr:YdcF family protein [Syntrophaceae bacterium]
MNRFLFLILCLLILAILAIIQAPAFLVVSDPPAKSDAAILFLGGEKGTREKEARQLVTEGWAEYLIIPARSQVQKLDPSGKFIRLDLKHSFSNLNQRTNELTNQRTDVHLPLKPKTSDSERTNELTKLRNWVVEDTHEETLIARDLMERMGLKSAILVSSPYHMRRIQLIARRVFDTQTDSPSKTDNTSLPSREGQREGAEKAHGNEFTLTHVPTRYETKSEGFWLFNSYDRRFILSEYAKIAWFLLYAPFV